MNKLVQIQNPHNGRLEQVMVYGLPDPQPSVVKIPALPRSTKFHPLLIVGIVIGALFGLIACLPGRIRACVTLAILIGIAWFAWTATKDQAQYAGTKHPVYSDYAPRAQLIRLPANSHK